VVVAVIAFLLLNVLMAVVGQRAFFDFARAAPARFPSPGESPAVK
jgi:hypothetical protein